MAAEITMGLQIPQPRGRHQGAYLIFLAGADLENRPSSSRESGRQEGGERAVGVEPVRSAIERRSGSYSRTPESSRAMSSLAI